MTTKLPEKGLKIYGVINPKNLDCRPICCSSNIDTSVESLDSDYSILVEMEVKKMYVQEVTKKLIEQ